MHINDDFDIRQFLGKDDPDELCKIRGHPNRRLNRTEDKRQLCDGGTITFVYSCPDCGALWDVTYHCTTSVAISADPGNQ